LKGWETIVEQHVQTTEIWSQMHQRLLSYIRGRVDKLHDAEDILQDVFVRIHAKLDEVRDTENVTAWIYQITRNVITDYYRERSRSGGRSRHRASGERRIRAVFGAYAQ
jgi:RNA polymerase sigma factor (sigma-70 family)